MEKTEKTIFDSLEIPSEDAGNVKVKAVQAAKSAKSRERFEWIEIEQPKQFTKRFKTEGKAVKSKRCPRCGWLDQASVNECFRCGYDFETNEMHLDFFKKENIELPPIEIKVDMSFQNLFSQKQYNTIDEYTLRLEAEKINLISGFDRLISVNDANITHYDYQINTALESLRRMRGQVLLADEVGLGKTIEAGLIAKELIERNLAKNILILTPASLVGQWQDEMLVKFGEHFTIPEKPDHWREPRIIASIDLAKRNEAANIVLSREFDLLIVDEAHRLKHRGTIGFKFVNKIKKKYVLLLTATPVHNDLTELYSLITILKPGLFGTIRSFKRKFMMKEDPRLPNNEDQLKHILNEVMIRNRRDKVGISLPPRRAAVYYLELSETERELYNEVTNYVREEFRKETSFEVHILSLITLQREVCSSPQATRHTLQNFLKRSYPEKTKEKLLYFVRLCESIPMSRKSKATIEILKKFPDKTIIFVEFIDTMKQLKMELEREGFSVELFHGGLAGTQARKEAIEQFRTKKQILISTQAGGEGLNLQFCRQIINYDLPWNPMRVEQRIGRVHRLGQEQEVFVFNLSVQETIEARILELLNNKIRMFELVIGELDMILGDVETDKTFEQQLIDIFLRSATDDDMKKQFEHFGDELAHVRKHYDKVRENAEILSDIVDV
ncbi:ATP-dependent helicase [bacterium]|nr:MAG: ATP-dependent helicase [bacterium]